MVNEWIEEEKKEIDYAEIYRQDYLDALDRVRELTLENAELRRENDLLRHQLDNAEMYIINNVEDEIIY